MVCVSFQKGRQKKKQLKIEAAQQQRECEFIDSRPNRSQADIFIHLMAFDVMAKAMVVKPLLNDAHRTNVHHHRNIKR
jgi:hypothetical protein